jgi:hypothetical protein
MIVKITEHILDYINQWQVEKETLQHKQLEYTMLLFVCSMK